MKNSLASQPVLRDVIDVHEVSRMTHLGRNKVYDLINNGHLPVVKFPGVRRTLVRRADVLALIERSTTTATK